MKQSKYDSIFNAQRGWVSRPPGAEPVAIVFSGGLDSFVTAARLMEEYRVTVLPIHIRRGQTNADAEWRAVNECLQLLRSRYGRLVGELAVVTAPVPPLEIKSTLVSRGGGLGYPLRDSMLLFLAVQAASTLPDVKSVFCAQVVDDRFPHSGLDSLRAVNVAVCENLKDWEWLITSPNIDPAFTSSGVSKIDEILWADRHALDVSSTITCNQATTSTGLLNCGACGSCGRRQMAFSAAGVVDRTSYAS